MTVQQVLKSKGDTPVVTIKPGSTLSDAASVLSAKRIGALVVSEDGAHVLGIISERDIVRELGRRGPSCMSDKVETVMTSRVVSCNRSDRAVDVMQVMTDGRFRHMPVVEDGRMIGFISIGDVVKTRLAELNMERDALTGMIMGN
jgi:CBS domain-containing protein